MNIEDEFNRIVELYDDEGNIVDSYGDGEDLFILPEVVDILKEFPQYVALGSNGKVYEYDECLLEVNQGESAEWIPKIKPEITDELLSMMFEICEYRDDEETLEWIDVDSDIILQMIADDDIDAKMRVLTNFNKYVNISESDLNMLTIREINDYEWQILI